MHSFNNKYLFFVAGAYYTGATLDYIIEIEDDYGEFLYKTGSYYDEDLDSILDCIFGKDVHTDTNAGLKKIFKKYAKRWVEDEINKISDGIEKIFEEVSQYKLYCAAIFSNGEAVYEQIK